VPTGVHYFKPCFASSWRRWALQPFAWRLGAPFCPMLRCQQ
jgi:hypothetical protein